MDAVEFVKTIREICHCHKTCSECPFRCEKGGCDICTTRDPREFVRIAEKWAGENHAEGARDESRNVLELMVALTDKVDRLGEKIKVAESMIEESRSVTDAAFGKVDEQFAEMGERIALCMWENSGAEKAKKKRTNKDVLLATFPNARMDHNGIPDMCPLVLDSQYDCNEFASCSLCKRTHWLAEVEE